MPVARHDDGDDIYIYIYIYIYTVKSWLSNKIHSKIMFDYRFVRKRKQFFSNRFAQPFVRVPFLSARLVRYFNWPSGF